MTFIGRTLLLGVDVGTSGTKVVLLDADGRAVDEATVTYDGRQCSGSAMRFDLVPQRASDRVAPTSAGGVNPQVDTEAVPNCDDNEEADPCARTAPSPAM